MEKDVTLIYGCTKKEYNTIESAINAAKKEARNQGGLSCELKIKTSETTKRTELYTFNSEGKKC